MVLDEPTVGLDPQTRNYIWQYVRDLRKVHHTAIFMTTHYMDEAENCDRIAIIDKGHIVALDTPAALKKMVGDDQIELTTHDNARVMEVIREDYQMPVSEREGQVVIQVPSAEQFAPKLLAELPALTDGVTIETIHPPAQSGRCVPEADRTHYPRRRRFQRSVQTQYAPLGPCQIGEQHGYTIGFSRQKTSNVLHTAVIWKSSTASGCATSRSSGAKRAACGVVSPARSYGCSF